VMALELFVTKDARGHNAILANEIAPRVHNSGHWSIEGAITSQFENHIRAVVNLPLGDTDNVHPAIMVNVLGQYPDISAVLNIDGAHYHS
ncbi:ATP-grasp domain-containing protein, partial [Pseudoalteromonas sp. SIMBA_153]